MLSLSDAIQLIRQGRKEEARQALEPLLRAEPGNITAWFWYVETCSTPEKRIQVLEVCLKMNPGNSKVMQALQTLRNQRSPQTPFTSPPPQPQKPLVSQPPQIPPSYSAMYDDKSKSPALSSNTPIYFDDKPDYPPAVTSAAPPAAAQKKHRRKTTLHMLIRPCFQRTNLRRNRMLFMMYG